MKNTVAILTFALSISALPARAGDCPQWGGSPARNNVADAKDLPIEWNVGQFDETSGQWLGKSAKNIRWVARLGSQTYGTPVISDGRVYCGTNNDAGYLKRYPAKVDLGCLLCFQEGDGRFAWQLSCEKLSDGRALDYPEVGICCAPLVEGKRLWTVTNRCEVVCLDTAGTDRQEAKIIWSCDMIRELGVVPHNMSSCAVTAAGDLLLVCTANGVDDAHENVPAPDAPSFIALDKRTGKLVWADNSPGGNILHGQWSSPAFAVIGGVPQAVFAGGDGWIYSFVIGTPTSGTNAGPRADTAKPAKAPKPELLWKFDCNAKESVWKDGGEGDRATLVATPVIYDDRVYIATGEDPEFGEGPGCLWCIDATKRGDVSPELVFDKAGKPVPPRRLQAADKAAGDVVRPNPNSAVVWRYTGRAAAGEKRDFKDAMHRTLAMPAIKNDLLVITDLAGLVHCLDVKTGKPHWTHDVLSAIWGSPLIVDARIYIGDEDGDVLVFELSPKLKILAKNSLSGAIYTTPVAANDTLFISTRSHLIAIGAEKK